MQSYSPFGKPIRDLQTADLKNLKQASEGWYIEYKRESPNAAAVAKSLSAFANTYGGWLFIGVQEESKENPVAGSFPGLPKEDIDPSLQRLRKSAADFLNPTPHFETRVLWGPDTALGLPEDRGIICAWIPQSATAPHVHKSGQIYRRVSDASEPRAESDRFILDQLWRRSQDIKRHHRDWYDQDPEFSEQEKSQPYVRLMLVADPWEERDVWIESDDDEVRAALGEAGGVSSIPFDTVYTSAGGFVGRQLNSNDPQNLVLTWRLQRNLVSDVIVPLPLYQPNRLDNLAVDLQGYKHGDDFIRVLGKYTPSKLRIIDLNYLFNILIGVTEIQERLCKLAGWPDSYLFKVKVLNAWRTIPFVDVATIIDRFDKYGLPMCLDSVSSSPRGIGPGNYAEISRYPELESEVTRVLVQAFVMFSPLALSFGIPPWIEHAEDATVTPYHESLQEAGRRAMDVQRLRSSKLRSTI